MWSALAFLTVALSAALALAQAPPPAQKDMAARKQAMMEQKAMMAKMAAADQTLDELIARMTSAKGDEKVAAIEAVVKELVSQRRQMHETCGMMKAASESAEATTEADHTEHRPAK
jgi:hypothetical protein